MFTSNKQLLKAYQFFSGVNVKDHDELALRICRYLEWYLNLIPQSISVDTPINRMFYEELLTLKSSIENRRGPNVRINGTNKSFTIDPICALTNIAGSFNISINEECKNSFKTVKDIALYISNQKK